MTLIDMAAREQDPDLQPPPENDIFGPRNPNHRGGTTIEQGSIADQAAACKTGNDGKPIEKTISCVSCRKRKLKCDRTKPKCGTCTRLLQQCEYPERRRNPGSKRRNMKELEARLAQVEIQLEAEQNKVKPTTTDGVEETIMEPDWNDLDIDMNLDMADDGLLDRTINGQFSGSMDTFDLNAANFMFNQLPPPAPTLPESDFFSFELLELGLQEPLPPQEMIDDLHRIYFDKYHSQIPFIHKYRYYTSLSKSPKFRPPVCLRYAMWAIAASLSDKYRCYEDLLYERARRYIQDAEMRGHGEQFVTIYHAQAWGLISSFEAKKTYFSRSWMSTGRMTRLVQMLGLYRLDIQAPEFKQILPPPRDWIELEERRRTFWAAYYGDRWASSGTGWPMVINEDEIKTNLPSSERAFEQGIMEPTNTLAKALTPDGCRNLSAFSGLVVSATLFGHNYKHLHKSGPDEHPEDLNNGEFWKRHRKMDNVLTNTFMFLPDHLRVPDNIRDMNVVFLHMNIHASCICLHQAAILTAEKNALDKNFIQQSRSRCLLAAEEIASIMRLVCHVDPITMHPYIGFCLYVAADVFVKDFRHGTQNANCLVNLEFLVSAMISIAKKHTVTNHFVAQVELDMQAAGIRKTTNTTDLMIPCEMPSTPINGILAQRNGTPMTYSNLQTFLATKTDTHATVNSLPGSGSTPNSGASPEVISEIIEPTKFWENGTTMTIKSRENSLDAGRIGQGILPDAQSRQNTGSQASGNRNTVQVPIRSTDPASGLGFVWPSQGEVLGHELAATKAPAVSQPPAMGMQRPFAWELSQEDEQSGRATTFPDDIGSGTWCPFTDQTGQ